MKQGPGYYYFIAMQTIPRVSTTDVDIIGTFTLNKSKKGDDKNKNYKVKDLEADLYRQHLLPPTTIRRSAPIFTAIWKSPAIPLLEPSSRLSRTIITC